MGFRLPPQALLTAFVTVLVATSSHPAAAQKGWPSVPAIPDGAVTVGRDWAELLFPPLELSNTGCSYVVTNPYSNERVRRYGWGSQTRFDDATARVDHFNTLFVLFELPEHVPITDARLDSALAAADIKVSEDRGEPPLPINVVAPRRAWARREGRSVRIRIEGDEALQALLRPRRDSIDVSWCQRDDSMHVHVPRRTRIVRH